MTKQIVPKVRFIGFDDVWEENKIVNKIKITAGGDVDKSKLKENGKFPVVANALTNNGVVGYYDNYKIEAPAVTVTGRGDVGHAIARHRSFTPIVRLLSLKSENFDIDFLENAINSMRILNESTGVPQLTAPQLGNYKITYPKLHEQSRIGSLFSTIDSLLSSYKDNLENYQAFKKSMLSKMFPKDGQTVPEIHLDGFEGEWEEIKISDVANEVQSGGTPSTKEQGYWNGEIPWIQSSDLMLDKLTGVKPQKFITNDGLVNSSAKLIPANSLAIVTRVGVGKLAIMEEEFATSQDFLSLSELNSDLVFLAYSISQLLKKEVHKLQGTSIKGITKDNLLSKKIKTPSILEQQAIGSFFSNLDNLIASCESKIDELEILKKKLLRDMFI